MRCRQARRKLEQLNWEFAANQELLKHLRQCSACAHLVESERLIKKTLAEEQRAESDEGLSFSMMKARIEHNATVSPKEPAWKKEFSLMSRVTDLFSRKPQWGIGIVTVAAILVLSAIIPFKYDRTVGYEVAFAGVDKNLALDSQKINELLAKLGMENAVVDVTGCEATCNLKISQLKSADDAKIIVAAFKDIDNLEVIDHIIPISEKTSGNFFEIAIDKAHGLKFIGDKSMDEIHEFIFERLGEHFNGNVEVWVTKSDGDSANVQIQFQPLDSLQGCTWVDSAAAGAIGSGEHMIIMKTINGGDSTCFVKTLENGELDDETIRQLKEKGFDVQTLIDNTDSTHLVRLMVTSDGNAAADSDMAAKGNAAIPENFALKQNYPNPFNPTTTIEFALPQSESVKLEVFNINGQKVKTLIDGQRSAGTHLIEWNGTNDNSEQVASGVYLYRLEAGSFSETKKMSFVK